jgi:hypothetical protein
MCSVSTIAVGDAAAALVPTVLVGCDDEWMGRAFDAILGDAGYPTLRVGKGADLLGHLHSADQPCVALSSLRWPPLNGAPSWRRWPPTPRSPPDTATCS